MIASSFNIIQQHLDHYSHKWKYISGTFINDVTRLGNKIYILQDSVGSNISDVINEWPPYLTRVLQVWILGFQFSPLNSSKTLSKFSWTSTIFGNDIIFAYAIKCSSSNDKMIMVKSEGMSLHSYDHLSVWEWNGNIYKFLT